MLHLLALVEKRRGAAVASSRAFQAALRLAPDEPQINNNYGNLLSAAGDVEAALTHFERALDVAPHFADARYNRALLLQKLGRLDEALADLDGIVASSAPSAKVEAARAALLRQMDRLDEAADAYDAALRANPIAPLALHGRARIALERGEPDASERYWRALETQPDDLILRLGLAEALEIEGDPKAVDVLARAVSERPQWPEGQTVLARMRWEAGEGRAFTRDIERALEAAPGDRQMWLAFASALGAADLADEAADAAARGRAAVGEDQGLQLVEALHASRAGKLGRADALFEALPPDVPGRNLHEVAHAIRRKRFEHALALANKARAEDEWNVGAWALTGLLWRLFGDDRAEWLHGQPSLVRVVQLELSVNQIGEIADRLRNLHRTRAHPIGQSLRGGTQTRGRLFARREPEVLLLRDAVQQGVREYWNALPPADAGHPLLRHRERTPRFGGSWSVRLTDGGFHVAHVHPEGVVSSACYIVVPESDQPERGRLEIGRPPRDLATSLPPVAQVEPVPGRLVLFPSTLFHGTRPFSAGERLTSAFDLVV